MKDDRFADRIGVEYALFPKAVPHYAELQRLAASLTASNCPAIGRVLEIGCGTGDTTQQLASALPQAEIIGIDAVELMVEQAKVAVVATNVTFLVAEAHAFLQAQPTASFDAVVTAFCLHNLQPNDRLAIFQEMGRVLRPGGILVQADKVAQDNILEHWIALREQIDAFQVFAEEGHPELQIEWTEHYLQDDRIRLTETEQRMLFAEADCAEVDLEACWRMDTVWYGIKR